MPTGAHGFSDHFVLFNEMVGIGSGAERIEDRFVAEPLFARTGKGHLKSEGVSTLQRIKSKGVK